MAAPELTAPTLTPNTASPATFQTNADYFFGTYIPTTLVGYASSLRTWSQTQTLANVREPETATIADDAVATFTPTRQGCLFGFLVQAATVTPNVARNGIAYVDVGSSDAYAEIIVATTSNDFDTGTGIPTGTTGTNGRWLISAHTDGNFYVENRSGQSRQIRIIWLGDN